MIVFNDPDQYIFVSASHRLGWDYGMEQWEMEALAECLGVPVDAVYACDTVGDLYNL